MSYRFGRESTHDSAAEGDQVHLGVVARVAAETFCGGLSGSIPCQTLDTASRRDAALADVKPRTTLDRVASAEGRARGS